MRNKTLMVPEHRRIYAARLMMLVAVIESLFLYLQGIKAFRTKSAGDLEVSAFIIVLFVSISWFMYGMFVVHDKALILSGFLNSSGAAFVLITISLYGDPQV